MLPPIKDTAKDGKKAPVSKQLPKLLGADGLSRA
jgi:hypothetical protein